MIFCAFITHHIRDATRRGLWFLLYGHTKPIPYWIYVSLIILLPWFIIKTIEYMTVIMHEVHTSKMMTTSNDNNNIGSKIIIV